MKEVEAGGSMSFGIGTVLFLIFMILKLTGHITWSWWWVTAPLWIPFALIGSLLVLGMAIAGIVALFER